MMADAAEPGKVASAPAFAEVSNAVGVVDPGELAKGIETFCGAGPVETVLGGISAQFLPPEQNDIADGEGGSLNAS